MPAQNPLQYAEIKDRYNKARSSGLFSEGSLVDYAKVGNQYQPGRYASVAEAGPVGLAAKELSYKFGEALDWTGLPKVTSDALGYVFPKLGGTEQGGRQAGEAVVTAGASMGIGAGIGAAVGSIVGLAAGPGAVAASPALASAGSAVGAGVTAFLFGLDAYEKSDSLKEAAFAAAVPTIAGKFAAMGTKSAMSILPKIPGANKIGLTGFTKSPGTIMRPDGMLVDVTTRGLTGIANKAAAFVGSEAGVTAGFAGIDLLRGEDLTNPDYWLGELAMSSVFSAKDLKHVFKPGTSNYDTIESTPYAKPVPPEPITPNFIKLASISDALSKSRTAREKALVIMDSTLDIAMKDKQVLAKRMAEVDFKTKKSTVTAEAAGMVANESSVAPKEFENTVVAWDALSNRALKAPKGEKGKAIRDVFTQFKAKLKADRKDSLYAALQFREDNLAKLRKDRVKAEEEIAIPEVAKIGQLIEHGDKELKLFSLNRGTFLTANKGARRLDDYKKILRSRGWTISEVKALHKAHVIEGWVRDKNSVSEENLKFYFKEDGTLKTRKPAKKKEPANVTPEQVALGQPTAKPAPAAVNKVDLTGNQTFAADLEPDLRPVDVPVEPLAEAVEVQNDAADITPEGKAAVDQEAAEIAASAKAPVVGKVPVAPVDKLTARLDRIKALRGQADEFKAKASDALSKKDPNGPTVSMGGMERAPAEIAKIMEYLYYKVREGVARVQLKLALRKLYKDMDEAEADLYLDAVEAEVKDEVELEENDANPVVPVKVDKLWEDISQEWNYGSLLDNAAMFRERIKVLYRAATTKQMKNRIAEYSQALEAGIAYKTDTYNVLSSMSVQRANQIFQAKRKSGDNVDEFLDRIRVLTNTMLRVGKKKAGRPKGVGDEVLPSQYALSLEARDIRKRMRAFDMQKADIEKQLENHKAALTNNPNVNVDFIPQVKEVVQDVKPEERALVYAMDALQEFMTYKGHKAIQDMRGRKDVDAERSKLFSGKDMQLGPKKNFGQFEPAPERSLMISLMEVVKNYTERTGEMVTDAAGERAPKAAIDPRFEQAKKNVEKQLEPLKALVEAKEMESKAFIKEKNELYLQELEKMEPGLSKQIPQDRAANLLDTVANTSPEQLKTAIENDLFREFNKTVGRFYMPPSDGKSFGSEYYYDSETGLSKQTSIEKEFFLSDWDNKAEEVLGDSEDMAEYKDKSGTQDDDRGELLGIFEGFDEIDSNRFSEEEKIDNLVNKNPSKASVEFVNTPLQVIKKLVLDRKSKESPHETLKSFIADALFDAKGKRKPEGKIDKFFLQFLKPKVSEGSLPEIDANKVRQLYQATSKIIIDDMLAVRANKIHLTKDQILKPRESNVVIKTKRFDAKLGREVEVKEFQKFTMLDIYLNKIAEHPAFAKNISQIKQAFLSNDLTNPNRLGTEHLTNLYRYVSAKPPASTERSQKWMSVKTKSSNSKPIAKMVEEVINRQKGYGQIVNSDTLVGHVIEQFERGAIVDGQEVKISDALREDIRIETLNFLYLRPDFEPGVVIRSGFNGDTVDPLPKGQLRETEALEDAELPESPELPNQFGAEFEQVTQELDTLDNRYRESVSKTPEQLAAYNKQRDVLIQRSKQLRKAAGPAEKIESERIAKNLAGSQELSPKVYSPEESVKALDAQLEHLRSQSSDKPQAPTQDQKSSTSFQVQDDVWKYYDSAKTEPKRKLPNVVEDLYPQVFRWVELYKQNKNPRFAIQAKSFFDTIVQPGKPIPTHMQGGLRLLAETFGAQWRSEAATLSGEKFRLNKAAQEARIKFYDYESLKKHPSRASGLQDLIKLQESALAKYPDEVKTNASHKQHGEYIKLSYELQESKDNFAELIGRENPETLAKLKAEADRLTKEAEAKASQADLTQARLDRTAQFAPGVRGAEHTDTDFLLYRPRVGQIGREASPPRAASPEASKFLKRFFFGAESVYGSTPEHKALVNKFQDEGLEVITDPLHEPGDGWIGENDLKAVTDAAQGDRRVIYFAKPEEKPYLESIGLTVKPYGSDLIAHTRELSIQDSLVREVDRWAEQLRGEGVEENVIQELRPVYEQLVRLNNSHNKIVFGGLAKGEGSGRTLLAGKTQYVFNQIPQSWHKMNKKEKATASIFVLGHEMRHRMEKLYKEGRLGEEGTKTYEEAHAWVKQQKPEHLRDMLDIMIQLNLPKDFRNNPAISKVLETQGRDPEEFVTNFNTIMDFAFVEHNVKDFSDSMRLLPPQLRKVWQFMMKHLQNFTRSISTVFKGQAKKDMKFLTEKLSQLRNAANKAEEDLNDLQFFADLRSDRMASAMQERFEELRVDSDPRWEKVFRGAEKINFDDSNTSAGAKTWRTEVRNKFRSFIDRGEVMALFNPKAARAMKVLFNSGIQSTTKTSKILAELYGAKADRTADGRVTKGDKVFRAYQDDSVIRVTGDLTRNLKNQPENLNKAMFETQADGTFKPNEALLKEDKKLWERYQRMSSEQKSIFWEMEMRIFNATKMMQSEILDSISLDHRADLQKMIGIQLPDKHRLAEEMSNKLYGALEKMEDPMKSVDGYREFQEAEQMFDNKDAFNRAVRVAQELRGTLKEVKQFYAERPNYESLQRYTDYLVKMKKDGEESYTIQSNDKKAFIAAMEKAQAEGWDAGPVIKKGDKDSLVQLDNGLTQILTEHQRKIQAMLDRGDFGAVGTDSYKDAEEFFAANSVVDQVTRYQAAKNVYLPGTRRKLDKGYEELDRLGQMFHYVTRVNNAQMKQVSKKQFQHEINSAELKHDRDLREDLKQRAENFFSPDSELGSFITKWVAVHHLGFNFPSHVVELTQPYTMGISNLTAKYGTSWYQGFKTMNKAQKLAAKFMTEFSKAKKARRDKDFKIEDFVKTGDKQLDDLLIQAIKNHELRLNSLDTVEEQKRIASDHAAMANGEKPQGKVSSVMNAYADFSLGLYGVFTRHNNIVGTIAGYMAAKEHGRVKDVKGNSRNLTHDEAVAEAEAFNRGTMLTGGRAGRQAAPFQNKTVGQTVMSLGTYSTGWLSTLGYHMDIAFSKSRFPDATAQERKNHKKAFVSMLGSSFVFSGLMGMPFVGAMMKIASDLLDEDLEAEGIAFLDDLIGEPAIIESIMSGAANSFLDGAGIPIDLSSKMGIGGVFGFNPVTGYDATSLLGPTASMVKNFYNAGGAAIEGDLLGALKTGGPTWTKKIAEMVQNEGEFKSSDGRPLFDNNGQQDAISKTLYGLGFGNQDVKRAKLANRLEASVEHYANNKRTKEITKIAGLVEKDSWIAQQEIIKLVEAELADNETYKRLDPVKQQIEYNKAFRQIVNSVAEKAVSLQLPIDPRAEASKHSAKTMTKVISGLGVDMPDSSQMLRMSLKDAVYQKMGIAPPERSRRTIQSNMLLDQMQTQNPGYALPQVRALAGAM